MEIIRKKSRDLRRRGVKMASDTARLKRRKSPDDISGDGDLRTAVCGVCARGQGGRDE